MPLPATAEGLRASAALGRRIAALLDPGQAVAGVSAAPLAEELRGLGALRRATTEALRNEDFPLTAGWDYAGRDGITMPGRGRVVLRDATDEEMAPLSDAARAALGNARCDVSLNDAAYWSNIPARVWEYTLGDHQVLKKWLSYREAALLGRALTLDEVRYVSEMVRRVAALLLLEGELDGSYEVMR